jgi:hypothetical protein
LNTYDEMPNLVAHNNGTAPTLNVDTTLGNPAAGSLILTAPYSDYNQYVTVQKDFGTTMLQDWTGKKLHARVMIDSGFNPDPSYPSAAQFFVQSYLAGTGGAADTYPFAGNYINVPMDGVWQELIFDLSTVTVTGWDASKVESYGIQFNTGNGTPTGTATAPSGKPTPAIIHVDSFSLE